MISVSRRTEKIIFSLCKNDKILTNFITGVSCEEVTYMAHFIRRRIAWCLSLNVLLRPFLKVTSTL